MNYHLPNLFLLQRVTPPGLQGRFMQWPLQPVTMYPHRGAHFGSVALVIRRFLRVENAVFDYIQQRVSR